MAAGEGFLTGLQNLALGPLLLASLGEPFSGLRDRARVQFRNDPPRFGRAPPGVLGVGSGVGDAEGAPHLPCLLCPVHLDGEATPFDSLPLGGLLLRCLGVAEGLFSRPHLGVGVGVFRRDCLHPLGDGAQERRCGAPGLGDVLFDLLDRFRRRVAVPGGGALAPEPRRPCFVARGVEARASFYEILPVGARVSSSAVTVWRVCSAVFFAWVTSSSCSPAST